MIHQPVAFVNTFYAIRSIFIPRTHDFAPTRRVRTGHNGANTKILGKMNFFVDNANKNIYNELAFG